MDHSGRFDGVPNVVPFDRFGPPAGLPMPGQGPGPNPGDLAALDTERALLGAILVAGDAIDRAREIVRADDFLDPVHRQVFERMCIRRDDGEPIDFGMMKAVLGQADLGGTDIGTYLGNLTRSATTVSGAPGYARMISYAAQMRKVREISASGLERGSADCIENPAAFASWMIQALDEVACAGLSADMKRTTLGESAGRVMSRVGRLRSGGEEQGVTFGLPGLDRATLGMQPGQFIVLAGRPGMGKTATALHIARLAAQRSGAVGFISLEMNDRELAERVLSALAYDKREWSQISYRDIARARDMTDAEVARVYEASRVAHEIPIWIDQRSGLTLSQIAASARRMKLDAERKGIPFAALIVDHIGLVEPSTRYTGNRVQEMAQISSGLKGLARQLGVPIVGLCQLNRAVEHREDKMPVLSDLRDSGSIEQDADVVLGILREAYYLEIKSERTEEEEDRLIRQRDVLEIGILKQRSGPTIRIPCFCDIACNVLAELA